MNGGEGVDLEARGAATKLNWEDVRKIRSLRGVMTQVEIAAMFGIKQPHLSRILRGVAWREVDS